MDVTVRSRPCAGAPTATRPRFVGLSVPSFEAHFTPCVEIGWRLAQAHWGRGYATEGARAALALAFGELSLEQVVAFTVPANARSRGVPQMGRGPEGG